MKKNIYILFSLFAASIYFFFSFWQSSGTIDRSIVIPVGVSRLSEPEVATHSLPSNSSSSISDPKDISVSTQPMEDQYMSAAFDYSLGDARLIGEAGVMGSDEILTINPIEEGQLPPLNQGMVNVTGDNAGYRMLPDGMTFKDDIQIVLPYDSTLLPMGFTPNDIKTYYFDIKYGRWIEIERDSVDENNQLVISKVNHFTDFINAVLKTPEMPETSAYAPTQMNDIKAANPLEGLIMMQPPTANNSGSVSMSYPIEIPAGRQGMQPSLALNYNGTTASSWVGVGWDLSIPAITVETRWGVPRYDHTKESELYLLNGQQLVTKDAEGNIEKMPHRTNQWKLRADNPTETHFFPRVNETFDSIIRHGTNPTNYWWSVTDRNGITSYYGKQHDADAVDTNAVLRDGKGNIAHWGLTETRDIDGNTVRFYYSLVCHRGLLYDTTASLGQEIYIDSINYTGYVDAANNYQRGIYSVEFYRSHDRDDITINGNYGFKRVDSKFLCHITVLVESDCLYSYQLSYSTANRKTNYKNLLTDIYRLDGVPIGDCFIDGDLDIRDSLTFIYSSHKYIRTKFDYFLVPETSSLFGNQETILGYDDDISSFFITNPLSLGDFDHATALGATRSKSWGASGTATVGGGPVMVLSSVSAGGNFNYGRSKSEGALTLIDLDGDGLADKVYKRDGNVYFRKHVVSESGHHYFDSTEIWLQSINNFLLDVGENNAWGLQASAIVNYAGSWPKAKTSTTIYFADVNADGLPDLITDEGVLFNTLLNGVPTFRNFIKEQHENPEYQGDPNVITTSATEPCGGIIFDGSVNDSIACVVDLELDTIIKASVVDYSLEDFFNDYGDSTQYQYYYTYFVEDGGFTAHVYKKTIRCEPILKDPNIDAVRTWVAPKDGTIRLISNFQLLEDTTISRFHSKYANGVRYSIELNNHFTGWNQDSLVKARMVDKNDYFQKVDTFELSVSENSVLFFRLQSNGNRDFDKVKWVKDIQYINNLDSNPMNDHFNSENDFLVTGIHSVQAPEDGYISGKIEITCGNLNGKDFWLYVASSPNLLCDTILPRIHLTSNSDSTIIIPYLNVNQYKKINFYVTENSQIEKNDTLWKEIRIMPTLHFKANDSTNTDSVIFYPIVNFWKINHDIGTTIFDHFFYEHFGPMYRQWGQFGYHNSDTNQIEDLIDITTLNRHFSFYQSDTVDLHNSIYADPNIDENMEYTDASASFESQGMFNPLSQSTRWIEMIPNNKHQAWIGYGNITYITKDKISNTRMEEFFTTHETSDIPVYDHPVPNSYSTLYGPKTIRKINESKSKSRSTGAAVGIISLGYSTTKSTNKVVTDYMDLNGDRYPDFLGDIRVQYSMPWGGIGDELTWIDPELQVLTLNESNSSGQNFGASYPIETRMPSNDPKNAKITVNGSGSPSINIGSGSDTTFTTWMDINADGLPDKVSKDGRAALNLGYTFSSFEQWNIPTIRDGENINGGTSYGVSFDVAQGSIGGGLGLGISENNTKNMLVDFNGDGLPDFVRRENGNLIIKYNLGNGSFSSPETIQGINHLSYGISYNESLNLSFTVGFTFLGTFKFGIGASGSPYDKSFTKDKVQWVDINGDGYVDYVTSDDENSIYVRYNQTGKANLLKQVTNFTGSTIALDYEMPLSSYESPHRSWVLKSVKTNDPYSPIAGNTTYTTFEYKNPNYNRFERISYGYDTVITYQHNPENNNAVYRKTIQGYNNKSFIKKGRKTSETICDAAGKMYVETFYDVTITDANGTPIDDSECPGLYFPNRECEVTNYYEGMATPQITTKKCVTYDKKKNVVEYINLVDSANNVIHDNLRAEISYKTGMPNNMISLVESITVYNSNNEVVREKSAEYSPNGKLIKIIQYNETDQAEIELNYDQYGNITQITFPENAWQEKMWNKYVYDPVVHTYPITVSNALGYQSSAQYDYKWGKPIKTFDINGQEMRYEYDYIGRLTKIIGPNEIASNAPYTLKMEYYPANYSRWSINTPHVETSPHPIDTFSYAVTYHYDVQNPGNPMKTTLLCDGLGRVIQTKKDIDIGGTELSVVSGKVVLDPYGRTIKQYHPVTEELTKYYKYNYSFDQNTVTTTQYDLLDREIKVTLPNNTQTHMQYGFGNDAFGIKRFLTTTIDPLGNKLKTYTDPRKLQTTSIVDSTIVTKFAYNSLGELIRSTDPDNHPTSYSYNKFGQQISRTHPDAGTDHFTYDLAGNLISRQTQDLNNNNLTIDYLYKFNQLIEVHYPKNPENNVYYFYGDNTATNNRKGRVYAIEDASGRQEFSYGMMGEVIENIRTFALPNDPNTYTFAMGFEYDSWNRILSTTYPDGEHVLYEYNRGGQLSKMSSNYNNEVYNYVDFINYNKFEQRTHIYYGNGTKAEYQYDILQRLTHLRSISNNGVMQEIDYTFDAVNNITGISNSAEVLNNGLGGTYNHNYSYDNSYRLISSNGLWDNNNNSLNYQLALTYTNDGRIKTKTQTATTLIGGALSNFSYDNHYTYYDNQPHTVKRVLDAQNLVNQDFAWDANGNLTLHEHELNGTQRGLCWDEENRLMAVGDNNYTSYYLYDNAGERTYKLTGLNTMMNINGRWVNFAIMDNPTLYTSAYLVAGVQGYTKHYYAGSERVSSAIGLGGLANINDPLSIEKYENWEIKAGSLKDEMSRTINECLKNEYDIKNSLEFLQGMEEAAAGTMDRYFYHPDHLGSSSWITDGKGYAIQHLHYLPFGEDWVDQRNASWSAPYTFSGKEKDVETGYSYFGARYYDSGLSIWLSVDPMSDKYPNLTPYNYCANNPVILVDPDGEEFGDFYNQFGLYLGTDGIDDGRVYQTTDGVWFKNIIFSFLSYNSTSIPFANESKKNSYDNVKADPETDFLGVKNEFGLIQLTKMGNPGIINNDEREDSYSYLQKDGTMSPKAKHGDDWADPVVAAAFNYAVKQSGVTVVVNDASAYNPSYNLGHKTHKMGRDIDYKYITSNGVGSTNCFGLTKSDILLNKNFVKQLKLAGFITISCGRIPGTITDSSGIHDNHMHSSKK